MKEDAVAQVRAVTSPAAESRARGVVLASAVLVLPGVIALRASAGSLLVALLGLAAAVFLERCPRASLRITEVSRPAVPSPVRLGSGPQARWELVERDGRRSLVMHWR
jgi:hypothetical protein